MGLHSEAHLDRRFVEMVRQLNGYLNHFPKHEKYGLALEIRRAAYDVYGFIVEAQKRYQKKTSLTNMDIRHEQLRMFVRLAHELGYFEFRDGARADAAPEALAHRGAIVRFLADRLELELSKSTIARVCHGANFVGYRTWATRRFVRRHALYTYRRALAAGCIESVVSSLGHARRTASYRHMLNQAKDHHGLYCQLPKSLRRAHDLRAARP